MPRGQDWDATRGSGNRVVRDGNAPTAARPGRPLSPQLDDRILEAALAMLADVGYAQLRLDALAARAGVAKTTILRRWPSKAAVAPRLYTGSRCRRLRYPNPTTCAKTCKRC